MVWQSPEGLAGQRVGGKGQRTGTADVPGQTRHSLTGCRATAETAPCDLRPEGAEEPQRLLRSRARWSGQLTRNMDLRQPGEGARGERMTRRAVSKGPGRAGALAGQVGRKGRARELQAGHV